MRIAMYASLTVSVSSLTLSQVTGTYLRSSFQQELVSSVIQMLYFLKIFPARF
jgi:hypothetical protein